MKATMSAMLVAIGVLMGLMLNHVMVRPSLSNCEPAGSASASVPTATHAMPATTMVPATPPTIQAVQVYPCADPANICDHLKDIGCTIHSWCRDTISKLGEDVCLKLYEAKSAPQVRALGVMCQ